MIRFNAQVRYELRALRSAVWLPALVAASLVAATAMTFIVGLFNTEYLALDALDHWALLATQGGTFGWLPFYAFPLAILGVLMWAQDAGGESAYVGYASFPERWRIALVRTILVTTLSALTSLLCFVLVVGISLSVLDAPPATDFLGLLGVKAVWTMVCGVAFANLGAMLCVVSRSAVIAISLLVLLPWVLEPIIVELAALAEPLTWLQPALRFLPFRVAGDTLGSPYWESMTEELLIQLEPRAAALVSMLWAALAIAVVQWRHCRADGGAGR